jgi:hypothetical protein
MGSCEHGDKPSSSIWGGGGISLLAEQLSAPQKRLYSMELVHGEFSI